MLFHQTPILVFLLDQAAILVKKVLFGQKVLCQTPPSSSIVIHFQVFQ